MQGGRVGATKNGTGKRRCRGRDGGGVVVVVPVRSAVDKKKG